MKIKGDRAASFAIVALVYVLAGAVGFVTYSCCDGHFALRLLFVSVPMADKRQARKDGFSEYKSQTRMLLPIPKRPRG